MNKKETKKMGTHKGKILNPFTFEEIKVFLKAKATFGCTLV